MGHGPGARGYRFPVPRWLCAVVCVVVVAKVINRELVPAAMESSLVRARAAELAAVPGPEMVAASSFGLEQPSK